MKKVLEKMAPYRSLVPAAVVASAVVIGTSGYVAKKYEVKAVAESSKKTTTDTGSKLKTGKLRKLKKHSKTNKKASKLSKVAEGTYKDGTYTGSAQGYGGPIQVEVVVKGGKISKVTVLSHSGETPGYYSKVMGLPGKIVSANSTNVDTVSGATFSSNGIINAVRNALAKAGGKEKPSNSTAGASKRPVAKKVKKPKKVKEPTSYKDGTYFGTAPGYGAESGSGEKIKVKVVVKHGKICSVQVVNHSGETPSFYTKVTGLPNLIVKKNSTNVDTVSGATFSSNGIINAVRNALAKAGGKEKPSNSTAGASKHPAAKKVKKPKKVKEPTGYKDGTYFGTAPGYGAESGSGEKIKVKVVVKHGKICSVQVVNHSGETPSFYTKVTGLPNLIVKKNSTNVDTVSGATFSSNGIINAVRDALKDAALSKKAKKDIQKKNTKKKINNLPKDGKYEDYTGKKFKEGTYYATVKVEPNRFNQFTAYDLKIGYKISSTGNWISDIDSATQIGDPIDNRNDMFIDMAKTPILEKLLSIGKGSRKIPIEVGQADVVSGATCTSKSIYEGARKALSEAEIK